MTHHCPKCELRFTWQTELEDHCRTEHPQFHHDYPVGGVHHADYVQPDEAPAKAEPAKTAPSDSISAILKTWWSER